MNKALLTVFLGSFLIPAGAVEFYVSPDGRPEASGSSDDPWDIATAFAHPAAVQPGDVLWLRGGTYTDGTGRRLLFSKLKGTAEQPIIVRGRPGERVVVDGGIAIEGESTWFWGFEITSSQTVREADANGVIPMNDAINCRAPNTKLINLIIHDTRQGMGVWSEAPDTEVYGNLIYYNGYQDKDRAHGHGIYFQNKDGAKLIADNIVFSQFYAGLHGYGSNSAFIRNVTLDGNIVFSNGQLSRREQYVDNLLLWPGTPMENIVVRDNFTYFPSRAAGYSRVGTLGSAVHRNVSVTGNYWIGGYIAVMMSEWEQAEFRNNVAYSDNGHIAWLETPPAPEAYIWDNNTYYGKSFFTAESKTNSWDAWRQKTSFDSNSTYQQSKPKGAWTFVRPNKFDADRAHIAVYNWDLAEAVGVDLSPLLNAGDSFEIRDAQNFFGDPVFSGSFVGNPVMIPMHGLTVAQPNGVVPTAPRHTAPEFGAFILLRTGRAAE